MTRLPTRLVLPALALSAAFAYACSIPSTGACKTDADCSGGGQCLEGLCTGGEVPTAAFTAPAEVALGALVTLDGSASAKADGSTEGLVYTWTVLSPAGVTLSGADTNKPTFTATLPKETYRVQLMVSDRGTASAAVTQDIKVANTKPVAAITGGDGAWSRDADVALSASTSTDADGDTLTYTWTLTKDPTTAGGTLTPSGATATLRTGTTAASYTVTLVVSDGALSDTTSITRALENLPPTVTLGSGSATVPHTCTRPGGTLSCEATGQFSVTATDADGTINLSSIAWTLRSAPPAANAQATFSPVSDQGLTTAFRIFNGGTSALAGSYELAVTIADNDGSTTTLVIPVTVGNGAPVADPASETVVEADHTYDGENTEFVSTFSLPASASDPDGDDVSLVFGTPTIEAAGLEASLVNVAVTGTAPSRSLSVRVKLEGAAFLGNEGSPQFAVPVTLTDVNGATASARYLFKMKNRAPTATAPAPATLPGHNYGPVGGRIAQTGYYGTFVVGTAVFADPDGDPLTTNWDKGTGETVLLVDVTGDRNAPTSLTLFATAPSIVGRPVNVLGRTEDTFGASAQTTVAYTMGNRAPAYTGTATFVGATSTGHSFGTYAGVAARYYNEFNFNAQMTAADPDGDPVTISFSSTDTQVAVRAVGTASAPEGVALYGVAVGVNKTIAVKRTLSDGIAAGIVSTENFKMGNRVPTITGFAGQTNPGHTYVATGPRYEQTYPMSPAPTFVDPDGDPLTITFAGPTMVENVNNILNEYEVTATPLGPATAPTGLKLSSPRPHAVTRNLAVSLLADDAVGGSTGTTVTQNFVMGNRAPTLANFNNIATPGHTYTTSGGYSAVFTVAPALSLTDPDGDPATVTFAMTSIGVPVTFTPSAGALPASFTISSASPSVVEADLTVTATVTDAIAPATVTKLFRMGNRAPVITAATVAPASACALQTSNCTQCARGALACDTGATQNTIPLVTPTLNATATDADGDPITVAWSSTSPTTVYANAFATTPTMNCTSGVACPAISTINLGRAIATVTVAPNPLSCVGTTTRRTAVQVTNVIATPADSIGRYTGTAPAERSTPVTFTGVTNILNCAIVIDPGGGGQSG